MLHSGEVYDHDQVRWYGCHNVQQHIRHYHNIGDAFVYDSSLKLLKYEGIKGVELVEPKQADIDWINAECSYVLLRGSNYIHAQVQWPKGTVELLSKLKIPVLAFGIGAQAPSQGSLVLSDETKRILHLHS
jgi:hypothetical protein